ncbi:hypothetical protein E2C01_044445 [Portunus trituberculatus]|uniref:Uncharacterized protein n=1 Tax=Portunus trituberculatus TaxID=210409 RepID=A0A5B7FYH6_PORTR|nr:hypothetical protein [Portunus trituberculatus]
MTQKLQNMAVTFRIRVTCHTRKHRPVRKACDITAAFHVTCTDVATTLPGPRYHKKCCRGTITSTTRSVHFEAY